MDHIQERYNRALCYYHLTKNGHAAATCIKAMDHLSALAERHTDTTIALLHLQLSLLYINIASTTLFTTNTTLTPRLAKQFGLPSTLPTSIDQFCLTIWARLDKDGHYDPRLVSAYLLMTLKLAVPTIGRKVAEGWLPSSDPGPDSLQVMEIYATRILPGCNDLDSARSFVENNSMLSDENKETFHRLIQLAEDDQIRSREEEQKRRMLDKKRQIVARESQARRKREALLKRQRRRTEPSTKALPEPEPEQGSTIIKTWIHHLKVTGSVTIMVVFFALLGLLKGPRGYLTESLRMIMVKVWKMSRTGTKVNHI